MRVGPGGGRGGGDVVERRPGRWMRGRIDRLRRRIRAGALGEYAPDGGGHKLARMRSLKHVSAQWGIACDSPPARRIPASACQTHHPRTHRPGLGSTSRFALGSEACGRGARR